MTEFVSPTGWELAGLVCQVIFYLAVAALAGTALNLAFYHDGSRASLSALLVYGLLGAVLGFHAALLNYLVQVGMISGNGMAGMFDRDMASLLIDTPQGDRTFWRLLGCLAGLLGLAFCLHRVRKLTGPPEAGLRATLVAVPSLAVLLLVFSFRSAGHVSVLPPLAQLAIVLHVLAIACWIGSLWPLHRLSRLLSGARLHGFMHRFGDHARLILAVLVASGVLLVWQLLQSPSELWQTAYGKLLLVKFLLVSGLMGLAALNRFTLVPVLAAQSNAAARLARSIRLELLLALLILAATAYLSTLVGPAGYH